MTIHNSALWNELRALALRRDGSRCSVSRLLGGRCSGGPLHVHHIEPVSDGGAPFDLDNLASVCPAHHPKWEALRRALVRERKEAEAAAVVEELGLEEELLSRCPHTHRSAEARRQCERRRARRLRRRRSITRELTSAAA